MSDPQPNCSQMLFDVQLTRRRILAADAWPYWPSELKRAAIAAEDRLKAVTGFDLAKALIEYSQATGQRVKV